MTGWLAVAILVLGVGAVAVVLWRRGASASDPTPETAPPPPASLSPPGGGVRVLYVEDNPANALLVRKILDREGGFDLAVAASGPVGVAMARERRPDVILMDLDLPGMSGLEALGRLKAIPETAAIPVIALTASDAPRDVERGMDAGFAAYLTKPIDITLFLETLRRIVGSVKA